MFESHWECILRLELLQKRGVCSNSDGRKYYYHYRLSANSNEGNESHINSQGSHFKPRLRTSLHIDGGLRASYLNFYDATN